MPKISLNPFDPDSIDAAIRQVKSYADTVEELGPKLVKKLTEDGVEAAKESALFMNAYDTGELVNGIVAQEREGDGYVVATAYHSKFVEMGTGIRGKQDPNPYDYLPGWTYDVNEHGEKGWWYPGKDGKYHWTKGMPHRPFMYQAAQKIKESVPETAKELLKEGGKGK